MSRLTVQRHTSRGRDRFRSYQLIVDGQRRGSIGHLELVTMDVAPGTHLLQARLGRYESEAFALTIADGADVYLELQAKAVASTGSGASMATWRSLDFHRVGPPVFPAHVKGLQRLSNVLWVVSVLSAAAAFSLRAFGGHDQDTHASAFMDTAIMTLLLVYGVWEYCQPRRPRKGG